MIMVVENIGLSGRKWLVSLKIPFWALLQRYFFKEPLNLSIDGASSTLRF